jgi:hypothetical protein
MERSKDCFKLPFQVVISDRLYNGSGSKNAE